MNQKKEQLIVICLDAYDAATGDKLIAEGKLKSLAKFKNKSACFEIEHGERGLSRYTGLTWEHFTSGLKPETSGKWSVMSFNPDNYEVIQSHTTLKPFLAEMDTKVIALDPPYFDLEQATNVFGIAGWGGHDTGMYLTSSPPDLYNEIKDKFGDQPDISELNTMIYNDPDATKSLGNKLCKSVQRRTEIAKWLLTERFNNWDVALLGYAETHDVIELMFHGIDPSHHAAKFDSAPLAKQAIEDVYESVSNAIDILQSEFPDASIVAFTMHGMGFNDTDLPTMILLPELMYRIEFEKPFFHAREDWKKSSSPSLIKGETWQSVINECLYDDEFILKTIKSKVMSKLGLNSENHVSLQNASKKIEVVPTEMNLQKKQKEFSVKWMPSAKYRKFWPNMKAFGLPAYFDGRIRVNLKGRESQGILELKDYDNYLEKLIAILHECTDIKTGEPVIKEISCPGKADPLNLDTTQADIKIIWNGSPIGFRHPKYGDIGPAPIRRVGGHSGDLGAVYIKSNLTKAGDYGKRSSFDVAPTIVDLIGKKCEVELDGKSLLTPEVIK